MFKLNFAIAVLVTIYNLLFGVRSYSLSDVDSLIKEKLTNYNKMLRPVINQSEILHVQVGFDLIAIQDLDEVHGKMSAVGIVYMSWRDQSITWDPSNYNGVDYLVIKNEHIWTPTMILTNSFNGMEKLGEDWHVIRIMSDGLTFLFPGSVFVANCPVDVTYYPLDTQSCGLSFNVWGFSDKEVRFTPMSENIFKNFYTENGAWDLVNSTVSMHKQDTLVTFFVTLKRKPRFVIANMYLPIIFMAFLNIMVFVIPTESGERISYCLTVLLAITVFLTLVGENLPKTSNPMSIFSYFLLSVLIISVCVTLVTIASLHVYYRTEEIPVPLCLQTLVMCLSCGRQQRRIQQKYSSHSRGLDTNRHKSNDPFNNKTPPFSKVCLPQRVIYDIDADIGNQCHETRSTDSCLNPDLRHHQPHVNKSTEMNGSYKDGINELSMDATTFTGTNRNTDKHILTETHPVSWKEVSIVLDKVFFLIFAVLLTSDVVVFLLIMMQLV